MQDSKETAKEILTRLRGLVVMKRFNNSNTLDMQKLELIERLLKDNNPFFDLNMETSYGILRYLGIEEKDINDVYATLVSPASFKETRRPFRFDPDRKGRG